MVTPEFAELTGHIRGYQRSRAVTIVAELGVADVLAEGPRCVDDLATATGTDPDALYRLLRALASIGIFHEDDQRRFALTAVGEYLRRDHPLSLDPVARMLGAEHEWRMWGQLRNCVDTGEVASVRTLGVDTWEYLRQHPPQNELFDAAMRTISRAAIPPILQRYDFTRHRVIADIGGGTGGLLAAILADSPDSRGILFDQPHVVTAASNVLRQAGVHDRVQVVAGNFFAEIPEGADAYVLSHILHDWSDTDAHRILTSIRTAMGSEAHLIILDAVVGPPNTDPLVNFLDLQMLVSLGGRERSAPEWRVLLSEAGFQMRTHTRAGVNIDIIEAQPTIDPPRRHHRQVKSATPRANRS